MFASELVLPNIKLFPVDDGASCLFVPKADDALLLKGEGVDDWAVFVPPKANPPGLLSADPPKPKALFVFGADAEKELLAPKEFCGCDCD